MEPMEEEREEANYNCSQPELYTVAETIGDSFTAHQAELIDYNTDYTPTTGTDLKAEAQAARAMPDEDVRRGGQKALKRQLGAAALVCFVLFNQLATAIRKAFGEDESAMLDEAGKASYRAGQQGNWDSVTVMNTTVLDFVAAHAAELTAGGLPGNYVASMTTASSNFGTAYAAYLNKRKRNTELTDEKLKADNALKAKVQDLCEDGRKVFRLNAAVRKEFTFSAVLAMIRSNAKKHSLSGTVTRAADGTPVVQAVAKLEQILLDGSIGRTEVVKTDVNGLFKFMTADGLYRLSISAVGLLSAVRDVDVDGGPEEEDFGLVAG